MAECFGRQDRKGGGLTGPALGIDIADGELFRKTGVAGGTGCGGAIAEVVVVDAREIAVHLNRGNRVVCRGVAQCGNATKEGLHGAVDRLVVCDPRRAMRKWVRYQGGEQLGEEIKLTLVLGGLLEGMQSGQGALRHIRRLVHATVYEGMAV